ncbi:Signal transduction histidine-protein kinase ArlS [Frondihabitans sp. 762G35]|uniref:sensor histidine kinase n=1 Tax=Frondihabitans sp. 762G35 TaxID=1446794 RepID=UPI000D22618A|nr:HAMP domain-containing sensor histidine kinase [Frondihabitans sp. 762G35]ARC57912.1 Signal transduction histidine-protein kinase ArlS [Frondihabitans sp. 762G35]
MKRLRSLSIQARITLGSLVVGAVVLVTVALILHFQIRAVTMRSEETLASSDLAPFATDLMKNPDEHPDPPSSGVLVALRTADGETLIDTFPEALRERIGDLAPADTTFRAAAEGTTFTIVGKTVATPDGRAGVWAARSNAAGDLTILAVDRSLVIGTLLALLAFSGAAWLLARLALRPVTRMRRTAEDLSRGTSEGDLPVGGSGDELDALASTLNAFIRRLRDSAAHERRMVSDASHELRTPLAVLTSRLELAHRSFGDAPALERELLAAETSVARLTQLAATLLELSRLDEADPDAPATERTPAADLVTEFYSAVDRGRSAAGSAVGVDYDIELLAVVPAVYALTPAAFGRVVDNLVINAVTFSPESSVVRLDLRQTPDGALRLTVADEGPGLPESFLPIAFDRFSRADESRRRVRGGSGLGLALVRAIAERAGGVATIRNREDGPGAAALVVLPRV